MTRIQLLRAIEREVGRRLLLKGHPSPLLDGLLAALRERFPLRQSFGQSEGTVDFSPEWAHVA